jgi:hypothetical protein
MSKFTVREGQQVENPAGGVFAAGESVELSDDEAEALVRAGVLDDSSGVFADREWAGQVTDPAGRVVGSEGEQGAPIGAVGGGTVQSRGAEETVESDEGGEGGSSRRSGRSSSK